MNLRFDQPLWLLLLLLAVPTVISGWVMLNSMSGLRRIVAIVVRCTLIAVLAALLAGLATERRTSKLALVAVIDSSDSVRVMATPQKVGGPEETVRELPAADAAYAFLAQVARGRSGEDLLGAVSAAESASVLRLPAAGQADLPRAPEENGSATDLAGALRLAAAIVPADATGRIVVISDGVETTGDVAKAAAELGTGGRGVPVDVVPIRFNVKDEVIFTSLDAPPRAQMGSTVSLRATLDSTGDTTGTLRIFDEGMPVAVGESGETARRVSLKAGTNVERLPLRLPAGRIHRFSALFEPDISGDGKPRGDTRTENNRAEAFTISPGKGAVLVVHGESEPQTEGPLERALADQDILVKRIASTAIPESMLEFETYDEVILDNVPADEVSEASQLLLTTFVRDMGGGLVMIGGRNSFGAGGWKGSKLEPILPVSLEVPDKVVTPETATVFVLDNSGSMGHQVSGSRFTQQQIANEAAALATMSLSARDLVGVVVFNSDADIVVPLAPNKDAQRTADAIRRISPDGGTNLAPGLELAHGMLQKATAKVRHIVVMTDGQSANPELLPDLAKQIAGEGIRITTIGVGDAADATGLDAIARAGGGKYYQVRDPNVLPRVFLKAVRVERQPLVREVPFDPVMNPVGSPMIAGLGKPPPLGGLSLTQARREPTVVNAMLTPEGEPVLAHWNAGLGQVVAFTSDADHWAQEWKSWPGYSVMWAQIARSVARPADSAGLEGDARVEGGRLKLTLDAAGADGGALDGLTVNAAVISESGERREVALAQVAPGRYEAVVADPSPGPNVALISSRGAGGAKPVVVVGATLARGGEYRVLRDGAASLERLAAATGGRVLELSKPNIAKFYDRSKITPRRVSIPLAELLLPWLLGLTLLDIAARRVAWDRWLPGRREVEQSPARANVVTAGLVSKLEQSVESAAEPVIALGDQDAKALADKARDERRARRAAGMRPAPPPPPIEPVAPKQDAPADEGGLLAAKRRAKERFEE